MRPVRTAIAFAVAALLAGALPAFALFEDDVAARRQAVAAAPTLNDAAPGVEAQDILLDGRRDLQISLRFGTGIDDAARRAATALLWLHQHRTNWGSWAEYRQPRHDQPQPADADFVLAWRRASPDFGRIVVVAYGANNVSLRLQVQGPLDDARAADAAELLRPAIAEASVPAAVEAVRWCDAGNRRLFSSFCASAMPAFCRSSWRDHRCR